MATTEKQLNLSMPLYREDSERYGDFKSEQYRESYKKLKVGNILDFEANVIQNVVNNEFATVNLRSFRNVFSDSPFKLDDDFIEEFQGKEPNWGELGWFVFKRTYARRVEDKNGESVRTEEWTEVVRRVVEGNLSLLKDDPLVTQEYGQKMFKLVWNLIWTPPGRGLWMSGTEFAKRSGDSLNNCWFVQTRPWNYGKTNKIFTRWKIDPEKRYSSYPFVFLFDQAMKGGGVGFSVEHDLIRQMGRVTTEVNLHFKVDESHGDYEELKEKANMFGLSLNNTEALDNCSLWLDTADSREGWAESLAVSIDTHFGTEEQVNLGINLSEVRKRGELIRGFGGVASGPAPLMELLQFVNRKLNEYKDSELDSVVATDFHNAIGRCVVAGNVRRTAEVALANPYDSNFINMKNYKLTSHVIKEWVQDEKTKEFKPVLKDVSELIAEGYAPSKAEDDFYSAWAQTNHRWASNNSVIIDDPRGYDFGFISGGIEANGEPGIFNRFLAQNFGRIIDSYREGRDKATGGNPCMEIDLESGEPCNLAELMAPVMYKEGVDPADVLPMMVHYVKRVTFSNYEWELSKDVIQNNRRIGISISGFVDWVLLRFGKSAIKGWVLYEKEEWNDMSWLDDREYNLYNNPNIYKEQPDYDPETQVIEPIYNEELVREIDRMYKIVVQSDIEYSKVLSDALGYEVKPSINRTTVKPSGTVSLLPGISPGVHFHYFRYGIRRVKVQSDDPLRGLVELAGYNTEESVSSPNSHVIEFPFKAPSADNPDFRSADEVTIEEQFAMQSILNIYWADNMVSCTVSFQESEKPKIKHLLEQYRTRIKSTSLLPYSGHGYQQAPYEPTSKEVYEKAMKKVQFSPQDLYRILMDQGEFEDAQMTLEDALECAGGHCPVR